MGVHMENKELMCGNKISEILFPSRVNSVSAVSNSVETKETKETK